MALIDVLARVGVGVSVMIVFAVALIVDPERLARTRRQWRVRLEHAGPSLAVLLCALGVNAVARRIGPELSWLIGWNVTGLIYSLEGAVVADLQSIATPGLTTLFGLSYVYGYVFLLVFPFVLYFTIEGPNPLRELAAAFTLNYTFGLVCFVLFIAYGPRNLIPDLVDPLLYSNFPQTRLLTRSVNRNTNVFPSLHTSLSVTVATQAWRTRATYPRWPVVAVPITVGVVVATMYLGIHWAIDVLAGVVLGVGSVRLAVQWVSPDGA
jgi:membrane-associated phospholipid phosphatase